LDDHNQVLALILKSLDDDKAEKTITIALDGKSSLADYMIISTGSSQRHLTAMAGHVQRGLKIAGCAKLQVEGVTQCDWILIDAGEIIVHLFREEVREFYNLEKIWCNLPLKQGQII